MPGPGLGSEEPPQEGDSLAPPGAVSSLPGALCFTSASCLAGGDMEEAELTSWRFVSSPYSLDLSNTKRHLVPGDLFLFQVSSGGPS